MGSPWCVIAVLLALASQSLGQKQASSAELLHGEVLVQDAAGFRAAVLNADVTTAFLDSEYIELNPADWPSSPNYVLFNRSLLVAPSPRLSSGIPPVLNFTNVFRAIKLRNGAKFTFRAVEVVHLDRALPYSAFVGEPAGADQPGAVELIDALNHIMQGPSLTIGVAYKNTPRPFDYPGTQNFTYYGGNYSLPSPWNTSRVYLQGGSWDDVAFTLPITPDGAGGFTIWGKSCKIVLDSFLPSTCPKNSTQMDCVDAQTIKARMEPTKGYQANAGTTDRAWQATNNTGSANTNATEAVPQRSSGANKARLAWLLPVTIVCPLALIALTGFLYWRKLVTAPHELPKFLRPHLSGPSAEIGLFGSFSTRFSVTRRTPRGIKLGRLLGQGSYGQVFQGLWQGRAVAVKVISHTSAQSQRIATELEVCMALKHPNVVESYWHETKVAPGGVLGALVAGSSAAEGSSGMQSGTPKAGGKGSKSKGKTHLLPSANSTPLTLAMTASGALTPSANATPLIGAATSAANAVPVAQVVDVEAPAQGHSPRDDLRPEHDQQGEQLLQQQGPSDDTEPGLPSAPAFTSTLLDSAPALASGATPGSAGSPAKRCETWVVMELMGSGSLQEAVKRQRLPLDPATGRPELRSVLLLAKDVACGMAYLHSKRVCHGDLKAENVLLSSAASQSNGSSPNGKDQAPASASAAPFTAKVSDFSLSRVVAEGKSHLSTRNFGTVTHMPPELIRGGQLRTSADVYSFAIMLWEVLMGGQRAFSGLQPGTIIQRVVVQQERPQLPPGTNQDFADLLAACWHQDPEARPCFEEVMERIDAMLAPVHCHV